MNPRTTRNPNLTSSSELEKMSERKGLLSEQLSAAVRDSPKLRRVSFGREKNHAEIKMIFSQQERTTLGARTIFGCSPPVRASNPVPSDSKFLTNTFNSASNNVSFESSDTR